MTRVLISFRPTSTSGAMPNATSQSQPRLTSATSSLAAGGFEPPLAVPGAAEALLFPRLVGLLVRLVG